MNRIGVNFNHVELENLKKAELKEDLVKESKEKTLIESVTVKLVDENIVVDKSDKGDKITPPENMDINPNTNDNNETLFAVWNGNDPKFDWDLVRNGDKVLYEGKILEAREVDGVITFVEGTITPDDYEEGRGDYGPNPNGRVY